jgi:photosystem II stability/assembly factor-like uncharacterized protein
MNRRHLLLLIILIFCTSFAAGCNGNAIVNVATFTPGAPTQAPPKIEATPQPTNTPIPPTSTPIKNSIGVTITDLKMVDGPNGWGIGQAAGNLNDLVLRTSDGGVSWRNISPPDAYKDGSTSGIAALSSFLDNLHAWVLFYPRTVEPGVTPVAVVWRTIDGGKSWLSSPLPLQGLTMDFFEPAQIGFSSWQSGWLFAHLGQAMQHDYVAVFTTQDGGASWKTIVSASSETLPTGGYKKGVTFLNSKNGWASGTYNGVTPGLYFWRTRDGGDTWQRQILPVPEGMPEDLFINEKNICGADAPRFIDEQSGIMMVTCTSYSFEQPRSWLYVTFDSGQTWNGRSLPGSNGTLNFLTPYQGWFLGLSDPAKPAAYQVFSTQDSGLHWNSIAPVTWNGQLYFLTPQVGWGMVKLNDAHTLVKTTNGGYSWSQINSTVLP